MANFDPKAYLASKGVQTDSSGFDPAAYLASKGVSGSDTDNILSSVSKKVDDKMGANNTWAQNRAGVGQGMDYLSGLARTGVAQVGDAGQRAKDFVLGKEDKPNVTEEDWNKAISGHAPELKEYMERAGVPEMGSVNLPVVGNVTGRGVVGGLAQEAMNPLNYLGAGASALEKYSGKGIDALRAALSSGHEAMNLPAELLAKAGKATYKSGLKGVDAIAAKYGKEPVSDLLMSKGITGSNQAILDQMEKLGTKTLDERNAILAQSARSPIGNGADMNAAMAPVDNRVAAWRSSKDPATQEIANMFDDKAKLYKALNAKPAEDYLRELPYTAKMGGHTPISIDPGNSVVTGNPYEMIDAKQATGLPANKRISSTMIASEKSVPKVIPGATVPDQIVPMKPQTVIDRTEPTLGPSAIQTSGYKTSVGANIPDKYFQNDASRNLVMSGAKDMYHGLKTATENEVGNTLGDEAKNTLIQKNDELGRLLTAQDKQAAEAAKEAGKNHWTSVDGMLVHNPAMLATKKASDLLKTTWLRTNAGKIMNDVGNGQVTGPAFSGLARQGFTNSNQSPWDKLK